MSSNPSGLVIALATPDSIVCEGATLTIAVRVKAANSVNIRRATVELVRTLTYGYLRGVTSSIDRIALVCAQSPMDGVAALEAGEVLERTVRLTVPDVGPGTTNGKLIQIRWSVRACFEVPGHPDAVREKEIEVRSRALVCQRDADLAPLDESRGVVAMSFDELSSRTLLPGIPQSGSVRIKALKSVPARSIRVELVLTEEVEYGPHRIEDATRSPSNDGKEVETIIARVVVNSTDFSLGHDLSTLAVPFSLDVPSPLPAPSVSIPGVKIRWALRVIVDIPFRRDPRLTLPLLGVTTLSSWAT